MSLLENKIGIHTFISLKGYWNPPAQIKQIDDRPGVNGSELILVGKKGEPFTMISQTDAESYEGALSYILDYLALIDGDAVEVVKGGVSCETFGFRCSVLRVREIDCFAIRGAAGNYLSPPSQGFVIAEWTLIAIPLE
jgi:hypothetical protein